MPLDAALIVLPVIGVALNGTSSVLYGSVPELVAPEKRTRAFSIFYTGAIGSGALAPTVYGILGDVAGISTAVTIAAGILLLTLPLTAVLRSALVATEKS
jgi:MFS family permease